MKRLGPPVVGGDAKARQGRGHVEQLAYLFVQRHARDQSAGARFGIGTHVGGLCSGRNSRRHEERTVPGDGAPRFLRCLAYVSGFIFLHACLADE
jgi:hypothetical protein